MNLDIKNLSEHENELGTNLFVDEDPSNTLVLVEDKLYEIDEDYKVVDEMDVDPSSTESLEKSIAEGFDERGDDIPDNLTIYRDDEDMYDTNVINDYGVLITYEEARDYLSEEEREDLDSFEEFFSKAEHEPEEDPD